MGKPFTVNINRFDPYKTYRFLVYFGTSTSPVAAVSKVGGIKRSSDVIEYKEGGNPVILKGLGRTQYDPITLERGLTQDQDFVEWANASQVLDKGAPRTSLKNLRREVRIDLLNEEGQARPDLAAGANAVALEHIKLENEGWEQDTSLAEPAEQ